jgi:beta-N-acetylhexosaminidase
MKSISWIALLAGAVVVSAAPPATPTAPWMRSLSLKDKLAQLLVMPCYGENPSTRSKSFQEFRHWVRDLHIGGLIVVNRVVRGSVQNSEPYALATFLNRMQKMSKLPLLVAGDFERGASMRVSNTVKFPHAMAYSAGGDARATRWLGAFTAAEAHALGIGWILVPVADVNNNPDNPIINIRSYGEDPAAVSAHVRAFIEGAHSDPKLRVLTAAKHFPGHGDTATDSHLGMPRLEVSRERLDRVEFPPFREAIRAGTDAVMTAHIALPAVDPEPVPATLSAPVLTGLLRKEFGFRGLIVTDAMEMQGLTRQFGPGEASVRAIEAGADVLLMPTDADAALAALLKAVKSNRLSRKRIDESVARVLAAKTRAGLMRKRFVDTEAINDSTESPEAEAHAQSVAERALTLVRNQPAQLPLAAPASACFYTLAESRFSRQGVVFAEELRKRLPAANLTALDATAPDALLDQAIQRSTTCTQVVVAAFSTVAAYRGNVALAGGFPRLMDALARGRAPVTLVSLGSPYLLRSWPQVAAYLATFTTVPASETAAVKALFGEIPITGALPVTIPGLAKLGDGIRLPAR